MGQSVGPPKRTRWVSRAPFPSTHRFAVRLTGSCRNGRALAMLPCSLPLPIRSNPFRGTCRISGCVKRKPWREWSHTREASGMPTGADGLRLGRTSLTLMWLRLAAGGTLRLSRPAIKRGCGYDAACRSRRGGVALSQVIGHSCGHTGFHVENWYGLEVVSRKQVGNTVGA